MKTFLTTLAAWGIFLGSTYLMLHQESKNPETFIQVKVLKKELDNARNLCHNGASDVIVLDSKNQAKYLPCSDIQTTEFKMKIVINKCYGGYSLSPKALKELAKRKGKECYFFKSEITKGFKTKFTKISIDETEKVSCVFAFDSPTPKENDNGWFQLHSVMADRYERTDKDLIAVVEKLGKEANGDYSELEVVEIPDGIDYEIEKYDGVEWVAEKHRTWS